MTTRQWIMVAAAFIGVGFGLFAIVRHTSDARIEACSKQCAAEGKKFVVPPSGTVGRFVDGASNPTDPDVRCICTDALSQR